MIYYRSVFFFFGNKSDWCGCLMLLVNVYKFTPSPVVESSYYFKRGPVLGGGGGGVLPYQSLMGMCHWMGSHFQ